MKDECLTFMHIGLYSLSSRAMRGVSADMLACGAGPAPAAAACNRRTGTFRVTVRGHVTDPLPFLAGRGLDRTEKFRPRRRFKPSGFRLRFQVLVPGSTVPERKTAELERRKVPVSQQWETTEGPTAPSGAPVPQLQCSGWEIPARR